ncbi:AraC family transcriptional regulator [Nocardia sp. NPDC127579]|uniref:helix-turn-helix transcriptional regulator n=1 Tax=Nocardia sp. NPDC127579 TaxID=3345402 RepID=UPI003629C293
MEADYETVEVNTDLVCEADRVDYWSAHSRTNQGDHRLDFVSPGHFAGTMRIQRGGGFQFVDAVAGAVTYLRTGRQARCDEYPSALGIVAHGDGVVIGHGDNEIDVSRGRIGLLDMGRSLRIAISAGTRVWAVGVPEEYVPKGIFRGGVPVLLDRQRGPTAAVLALLRTVSDHAGALSGDDFTGISTHAAELLNLALHPASAREQSRSAALAHCALDYIAAHSSDPRLTPDSMAEHLGCSRRTLEYALRGIGAAAPARLIADTRAEQAHRRLTDPRESASISEIAYAAGFDALSTFHRSFGRRYGESPTDVRRRRPSASG